MTIIPEQSDMEHQGECFGCSFAERYNCTYPLTTIAGGKDPCIGRYTSLTNSTGDMEIYVNLKRLEDL